MEKNFEKHTDCENAKYDCEIEEKTADMPEVRHIVCDLRDCVDDDDTVTVPRGEYDDLVADATMLRVVMQIVRKCPDHYGSFDTLRTVLDIDAKAEEAL